MQFELGTLFCFNEKFDEIIFSHGFLKLIPTHIVLKKKKKQQHQTEIMI